MSGVRTQTIYGLVGGDKGLYSGVYNIILSSNLILANIRFRSYDFR